ncbi:hypothetical protein GUITHDRAFT_102582 [Guillardia theta CCMP2712]|uniref:Uncharacterized protein n=1 Tax=Guillardia theta (strain CCMP2712) TaxID=905079 RepID=L1JUT6_GUITC|nr:hypothetical protein GUITHDRAFT_102582 [Guillardia theta CCMP2712]EKX51970.1 hypothetical protein GUITHDRAFT_102582 [Guillardia theta CCMP2712]|eukprot:XP_005838950.1 hypothetical protein GUITHDRAFT_102582 [Guillardia theta CCMP2712]
MKILCLLLALSSSVAQGAIATYQHQHVRIALRACTRFSPCQLRLRTLRLNGGAEVSIDQLKEFLADNPVDREEEEANLMAWLEQGDEKGDCPPVDEDFKQAVDRALKIFEQEMIAQGNPNWKADLRRSLGSIIPEALNTTMNQTRQSMKEEKPSSSLNLGSVFVNAAKHGNVTQIYDCLKLGLKVNVRACEYTGWSLLHWTIMSGKVDAVKLLISAGAKVDAKSFSGQTPCGADITLKNQEKDTARDVAKKNTMKEIVGLLEEWSGRDKSMSKLRDVEIISNPEH